MRETESERERDRETDRQTDRDRERHRERQTDRERESGTPHAFTAERVQWQTTEVASKLSSLTISREPS